MGTHKTLVQNCPNCGHFIDRTTNAANENVIPKKGDISVCFYCGKILVYEKDLRLRIATKTEIDSLPKEVLKDIHIALLVHKMR